MRNRIAPIQCAAVAVLVAATACRSESEFTEEAQRGEHVAQPVPGAPLPAVDSTQLPPESAVPQVQVSLSEWRIEAPDHMAVGTVTLRVHNAGTRPHALEIDGGGLHERTNPIPAGGEVQVTVNLRRGEYTFRCPVEDDAGAHRNRGLERKVVVQ